MLLDLVLAQQEGFESGEEMADPLKTGPGFIFVGATVSRMGGMGSLGGFRKEPGAKVDGSSQCYITEPSHTHVTVPGYHTFHDQAVLDFGMYCT